MAAQAKEAPAPFPDRRDLHILLCEKDPTAAREELRLLRRCHYQVTAVKTARQVVDFLDLCCPHIDLILTEVDLPDDNGFKLLKHVVRQERLQHIPIVVMSRRDDMAIVVKCLKLGAADYLVKPLRTNELLNLWTHIWRRRKVSVLAGKQAVCGSLDTPFHLLISEAGESIHTDSTHPFSGDTDDRIRVSSTHAASALVSHDLESEMSSGLELSLKPSLDLHALNHSLGSLSDKKCTTTAFMSSPPTKTELKVAKSSAFFTYTKVVNQRGEHFRDGKTTACKFSDGNLKRKAPECQLNPSEGYNVHVPVAESVARKAKSKLDTRRATSRSDNGSGEVEDQDSTNAVLNSFLHESPDGNLPQRLSSYGHPVGYTKFPAITQTPHSFVGGGMMNSTYYPPVLISPSMTLFHSSKQDDATNACSGSPSRNALQLSHGFPVLSTFPCYPFGLQGAPHLGTLSSWSAMQTMPVIDRKMSCTERREVALNKFRRKRKDRCFQKKIRYASRKKLAERRPRIRGQFASANHLEANAMDAQNEYDGEQDELECSELAVDSSPDCLPVESAERSSCML